MKNLKGNIVLLLSIFLSFESISQAIKLPKGSIVPYDTAAVMPIDSYRQVRLKVNTAENLIDSMRVENESLAKESILRDSTNSIQTSVILMQQKTIARKDSVNDLMMKNINALYKESTKRPPLIDRVWIKILAAGLVGYAIGK